MMMMLMLMMSMMLLMMVMLMLMMEKKCEEEKYEDDGDFSAYTQNTAAAAKHIESMKYFGYFVDDEKQQKYCRC